MKKTSILALLLIFALLLTSACSYIGDALNDALSNAAPNTPGINAPEAGSEPTPTPKPTPSVSDVTKFNAFVDAADVCTKSIVKCLEYYENRICPLKPEYAIKKKGFNGWIVYISDSTVKKLELAQTYAADEPFLEPVDSAYLALAPYAVKMVNVLLEIYDYYENKRYVDDDFAKGEELHVRLMENYDIYMEREAAFLPVFREMAHARTLAELDKFKQNDQMLLYWSNMFMLDARTLVDYLGTVEFKKDVAQMNSDEYAVLYEAVANDHTEFSALATREQADAEGIGTTFSLFKSPVDDFKRHSADVMQKLRDKNKVKADALNKLLDDFNDMISRYNMMIR